MTAPMFDFDVPPAAAHPEERLSADRRRTILALQVLQSGRHPLRRDRLHPDAPPADDRKAPGPRCRTCKHIGLQGGVAGSYIKCCLGPVTGGPGTDIRAWWPACEKWEAEA